MSIQRPTRCSRTRGKKGERHPDPEDPPRGRANKRRGHGTYDDNERPPIIGTAGRRRTAEVRLRVIKHTDKETLVPYVHRATPVPKRLSTPTSGVPTSGS